MSEKVNKTFIRATGRDVLDFVAEGLADQKRDGVVIPDIELPTLFERAQRIVKKGGLFLMQTVKSSEDS